MCACVRAQAAGTNMSGLAGTITFGVGAGGYAESNEVTLSSAQTFLEKLRRKDPYYKRNLPHICSFFQKGTCNRGTLCPYRYVMSLSVSAYAHHDRDIRHEKAPEGELAHQNIKDRYYGNNDPVARKMLRKLDRRQLRISHRC